jgi:hypothetical protein
MNMEKQYELVKSQGSGATSAINMMATTNQSSVKPLSRVYKNNYAGTDSQQMTPVNGQTKHGFSGK